MKITKELQKQYPLLNVKIKQSKMPFDGTYFIKVTTRLCAYVAIEDVTDELLSYAMEHAKRELIKTLKTQRS